MLLPPDFVCWNGVQLTWISIFGHNGIILGTTSCRISSVTLLHVLDFDPVNRKLRKKYRKLYTEFAE
jgi:hypothetical protein